MIQIALISILMFSFAAPLYPEAAKEAILEITSDKPFESFLSELQKSYPNHTQIAINPDYDPVNPNRYQHSHLIFSDHSNFLNFKKKYKKSTTVFVYEGEMHTVLKSLLPEIQTELFLQINLAHLSQEELLKSLSLIKERSPKNCVILINGINDLFNEKKDTFDESADPLLLIKNQIKEIDSGLGFWILENSALAFIPNPQIAISDLVSSYTTSRLEDFTDAELEKVLSAEKVISGHSLITSGLKGAYCATQNKENENSPYYYLWKGLAHMGKKEYYDASRAFHMAKAKGYQHWRVYWYISQAEFERRNFKEAKRALNIVMKVAPDFKPAADLSEKIDAL